jgi:hypothetical protein
MSTHRFNGVPINVDRLSPEEVANLEGYVQQRAAKVAGEMSVLASLRGLQTLPDNVFLHPTGETPQPPEAA